MKQLKDYIHLYIGCEIVIPSIDEELENWEGYTLSGVCFKEATIYHSEHGISQIHVDDIKLLLRPLSDMTEEEAKEIWDMCMPNTGYKFNHKDRLLCSTHTIVNIAPLIPEILYRGFDLFGLIDAGLAINAKETQNQTN